jgi:hypothetical protein
MKRLILLVLISFSIHSLSVAQEPLSEETKPLGIKWSPASMQVGKITAGVEYSFSHRNSVTFNAGIPFNKKKQLNYDGSQSDIQTKAYSVMAGYRRYLGKKNMRGFYIEPYAKYLNHEASGDITANVSSGDKNISTRFAYQGIGIGAQIGVQMIISRSIVLDLYFLGPEANKSKFSLIGQDNNPASTWSASDADEMENDIREALANVPLIGDKAVVNVDDYTKSAKVDYSGFLPGFRIGGSIGIRF